MAETQVIDTTPDDASGTDDAIRSFVNEESPEEQEQAKSRRQARDAEEDEANDRRREPEEEKAKPKAKDDEPDEKKKPEPKKDPPPEKRKLKVKQGDREEEIDEEEVTKGYLRRQDYTKKTQELAAERQAIEEFKAAAKSDPVAALRAVGLTDEEIRERIGSAAFKFFSDEIDPATGEPLSPEQKKARATERELQALRAKEAEREKALKAQEESQVQAEHERKLVKVIVGHLEKTQMPRHLLPRVAQHMADAVEADQTLDLSEAVEDASALAWEDVEAEHKALFGKMDGAQIEAKFPQAVQKIQAYLVEKWKAKKLNGTRPVEAVEPSARRTERRMRTVGGVLEDFVRGR